MKFFFCENYRLCFLLFGSAKHSKVSAFNKRFQTADPELLKHCLQLLVELFRTIGMYFVLYSWANSHFLL